MKNQRRGPGWWMDGEGVWREPADWPGDSPPISGWVKGEDEKWSAPPELPLVVPVAYSNDAGDTSVARQAPVPKTKSKDTKSKGKEATHKFRKSEVKASPDLKTGRRSAGRPKRSLQGQADVRAMLVVGSAIAVAVVVALGALILQSRADAVSEATATDSAPPEVVFPAETDEFRLQRRQAAAVEAPGIALMELLELEVDAADPSGENTTREIPDFDQAQWLAASEDECLDSAEQVLIDRSIAPITFADNLGCVPSVGLWSDPFLGIDITRTIDAEVRHLVPFEIVHSSGGWEWTPETRAAFVNDISHPATLAILSADSGHNPRSQGPELWRPSNQSSWCGYAVDWVTIKTRWELSVTSAELASLQEMLQTCSEPGSNGAHLSSMVIDPIEAPMIHRVASG